MSFILEKKVNDITTTTTPQHSPMGKETKTHEKNREYNLYAQLVMGCNDCEKINKQKPIACLLTVST